MPKNNAIQQPSVFELQQLVAIQNDSSAFEKLYLLFYKDLHQFALGIIKSNQIAEEIVSDVFVQIWKNRVRLADVKQLRVFLYVAIKNQALTYLYKVKKQKVCWIEEFANGTSYIKDTAQTDDRLNEKELSKKINSAINNLPPRCRAVFILVKEEGLTYAETAKILNLSVKTIENQMGIALKKIAQQLKLVIVNNR